MSLHWCWRMSDRYPPTVTLMKSGALHFKHPCGICGAPAHVGSGVNYRRYIKVKEDGGGADPRDLGRWRCFGCQDMGDKK